MCTFSAFCWSWNVKPLGELGHIDLGSILVIAREKELWHNLGTRSQLIWSGLRGGETCKGRFHLIPRSLHAICGGSDGPSCSQSLPFAKAWDIIRLLALFSPWWDLTAKCCFCHIFPYVTKGFLGTPCYQMLVCCAMLEATRLCNK